MLGCVKRVKPLGYNNSFEGSAFIITYFTFSLWDKKSYFMNTLEFVTWFSRHSVVELMVGWT